MRRGDVVLVQASGTPASQARPCVVVHHRGVPAGAGKVTVCPITSQAGSPYQRPSVHPTPENGLKHLSEIEVDWIFTVRSEKVRGRIGSIDHRTMFRVEDALRRWLDL